jgi:NADH:ubiquinone oxidoreductase subunit H
MDLIDFLIILGRVLATFVLLLLVTVLNVWIERKVLSDMQNGSDRTAPARGESCRRSPTD